MSLRTLNILVLVLLVVTGPVLAAKEFSLVSITVSGPSDVALIECAGVDVWSARDGVVTAAATPSDLTKLHDLGYSWTVIYATRADYERATSRVASPLVTAASYRTYDQVVAELQRIANQYPQIAVLQVIGSSYEGRPIYALKLSENPTPNRPTPVLPSVLFCGEHHAREWISLEVPLRLADYITSNYATDPSIRQRLNQTEVWIVPMVNPDGYVYSWTAGNRLWRKNRRPPPQGSTYYGVDINRNYGYHWGENDGSSPDPSADTYRGTAPFSESETQAMQNLFTMGTVRSFISYHSYQQLILWPWGYTYSPTADAANFSTFGNQMKSLILGVHGVSYTAEQASALYLTSGDIMDWGYGSKGGVFGYTIELRPADYPYFELPADQIIPTFEENLPAAMKVLDYTISQWPSVGFEVFSNRTGAAYDITGPANYSGSGSRWAKTGVPNGTYTITYRPITGWASPLPETVTVNSSLVTIQATYTTPVYQSIQTLKARANGQTAAVQRKQVTAVYSGCFYIQESNHFGGIRVNWPTPPAEGTYVTLVGRMTTADGERAINADWIQTVP